MDVDEDGDADVDAEALDAPNDSMEESDSESENESRPTFMTLCNPLMEDTSIRSQHHSNIFDNPNPVLKSSWAKDSKCKQNN